MKYPLFRMLRCDSVAPLGKPVVPEVYWMLIGSVLASPASRVAQLVGRHRVGVGTQPLPSRRCRGRRPRTARGPPAVTSSTMPR